MGTKAVQPTNLKLSKIRLLIVQYAGDYREAFHRLNQGGNETYYAQKYSVDAVAEVKEKIEEAITLCCLTEEPYDEMLPNGVRAIGAGFQTDIQVKSLLKLLEKQNPTHLLLRTPQRDVIRWAIRNKITTLLTLADSFQTQGLKNKIKNYWLANLLNNQHVSWVGNHGINACLSLKEIGVNPNKIIPWDFPSLVTPDSFLPKQLRTNVKSWNLLYVGTIQESKGVGDILDAVAQLKSKNFSVRLKLAGKGEDNYFSNKAKQLEIEDCIEFLGLVPNNSIVPLMREADLVCVPSRHEYPEGFPMTIYEALCSRTPIIASDHPMFQKNLKHRTNAMIFPAGNSIALTECIEKILADSVLYQKISVASADAWKSLQIPVQWADLINRWLDDSPENQQWLFSHRLASGRYDSVS